jgi:hypothetical protein
LSRNVALPPERDNFSGKSRGCEQCQPLDFTDSLRLVETRSRCCHCQGGTRVHAIEFDGPGRSGHAVIEIEYAAGITRSRSAQIFLRDEEIVTLECSLHISNALHKQLVRGCESQGLVNAASRVAQTECWPSGFCIAGCLQMRC